MLNSRYLRCSLCPCLYYTNLPLMDTKHSSFFKKLANANFRGLSRSRVRGRRGHFGDLPKRNAGATHLAGAKTKMAEVVKNPLPSGYEYEFISTVLEDHHCLICHLPLREPVQTRCGHRFCKKCLDEAIRRYENRKCCKAMLFFFFLLASSDRAKFLAFSKKKSNDVGKPFFN